jgi:hypothetical protein
LPVDHSLRVALYLWLSLFVGAGCLSVGDRSGLLALADQPDQIFPYPRNLQIHMDRACRRHRRSESPASLAKIAPSPPGIAPPLPGFMSA